MSDRNSPTDDDRSSSDRSDRSESTERTDDEAAATDPVDADRTAETDRSMDAERTTDEADRTAETERTTNETDRPTDVDRPVDETEPTADREPTSDPGDRTATDTGPPGEPAESTGIDRRTRSYLSGIASLFGLWIALSPFVYEGIAEMGTWNNVLVGAVIFIAAGYNFYRQYNATPANVGVSTLVALLGVWLVVAALALEMLDGAFWSTLVSGAIIAVLSGAVGYASRRARPVAGEREATGGR